MDDIAGDVELSKTTLYLYFKNKQSLFFAVVIKGLEILRDTFQRAIEEKTTGLAKIINIIHAISDYLKDHSDYYRLNISARSGRFGNMFDNNEIENAKKYMELTMELFNFLKEAFNLGISDGTIRNDLDPIQSIMFLGFAIETMVYESAEYLLLMKQDKITKEEYIQHSIDMILHGIAGEKKKN